MKVLIVDYDGTLFINEDDIKNNAKKIEEYRKRGNIFIISTARNFSTIKVECERYNIIVDYFFCDIGSVILDNCGRVIYKQYIDKESRIQIENILQFYEDNTIIKRYGTNYKQNKEIEDIVEYKIEGEIETLKKIKKAVDKATCKIRTQITEDNRMIIHTSTKEDIISIFLKISNIQEDAVITIGDELDDLEMLKKYNGYRMNKCNKIVERSIDKSVKSVSELINNILA